MSGTEKRLRSVLLLGISLIIALALAEWIIRLTPFGRPKLNMTSFFQYDRTLGWRNRPLARGTIYDWEFVTDLQYNSRGMRGPERPDAKPPDTYRILLVGDSFVDGYTVAAQDRVTEKLERLLNEAHPAKNVEAFAMGVAGYSIDQKLLWLEAEGWKLSPDLVVLMFFDDDVFGDGLPFYFGHKPQFLMKDGALVLHNVPVPEGPAGSHSHQATRWNIDKRFPDFHRWVEAHSRLYRLLFVDLGGLTPLPPFSPLYRRPETPEVRSAWDVTGALMRRMSVETREHSSQFLVFYIPRREDVYRREWDALGSRLGLRPETWDMRGVTSRFLTICRQESLDCMDPTAQFEEAATAHARQQRLYNKYDAHWTAAGNRLAAEILAEKIGPELGIDAQHRTISRRRP